MKKEITLSKPLKNGKTEITTFTMRKPFVGDLRGIKLTNLAETDVDAIIKVLPRILTPMVTPQELYLLEVEDLIKLTGEFTTFLFPNAVMPDEAGALTA